MIIRRTVLFIVLVSMVALAGCMGGGGQSAAPLVKDVAGINNTISGFMKSVAAKDPARADKYFAETLAQTTSESSTVHNLMVYDFGADIYNPEDNNSYNFSVNSSDIVQPTETNAIVKAFYILRSGQPLWITFMLVKENGVWMIETVSLGDTNSSGPINFQVSNYFPIIPGANYKMAQFLGTERQDTVTSMSFASSPDVSSGKEMYEFLVSNMHASASTPDVPPWLRPSSGNMEFAVESTGLWAYSPYINGGVAFKILENYHDFNSSHSFSVTWPDQNAGGSMISGNVTVEIGAPTSFLTGLQTYSAVALTFITSYISGGEPMEHKWVTWLAPGVGMVGTDEYWHATDTSSAYSERLFERTSGENTYTNMPTITNSSTLGNVVVGSAMTPVNFQASGGTSPYTWSLMNSNLPSGEYSFSSTGVLTGTPATQGTFSFEVVLTDSYGRSAYKTFSLTAQTSTTTPTTPTTPTTSYTIVASGNDTIPAGSHYEKLYSVSPEGATTISDVRIVSYNPTQGSYTPWAGFDSYYNQWMLSFMPEISGNFVFVMDITTADGQTHRLTHYLTVTQ
ncbi:MAG: hypothetical protein Kow0029_02910 [Candidatus Rifleibacteriota bacterium]